MKKKEPEVEAMPRRMKVVSMFKYGKKNNPQVSFDYSTISGGNYYCIELHKEKIQELLANGYRKVLNSEIKVEIDEND